MASSADEQVAPRRRGSKRQGRPPGGDSEATRRYIMDAAQLCFGEHGYRETSNRMIADMAGVTTGTIYHHFDNKRDLFLAIHAATQNDINERLKKIIASDLGFAEALDAMFRVFLTLHIERPNYQKFIAVVRTEALRNPDISSARVDSEWRGLYRDFAERAIRDGELDRKNMRALRTVLGAMVLGIAQHGVEANLADHKECLRGMLLLFQGQLVRPRAP